MAYEQSTAYQPPNRYYSKGAPQGQPAPRPAPQAQPRRGPAPQQQYDNYGGNGRAQQGNNGNYDQGYAAKGYDGYVDNGYDGYGGQGNYANNGYDEYGSNNQNGYDSSGYDEYNSGSYSSQNASNGYGNGNYGGMKGQYQQRPPPQQMRNGGGYGQGEPRGPPQQTNRAMPPPAGFGQRPGYERSLSNGPRERGRGPQGQNQQRPRDPRDRSRPAPRPPADESADTLAWDNPFPTFPTGKSKPGRNDVDSVENQMANASLESGRRSEDLPRPNLAVDRPRPSLDGIDRPRQYMNDARGNKPWPIDDRSQGDGYGTRGLAGQRQPPPIQTQGMQRPYEQNPNQQFQRSQTTPSSAIEPRMGIDRSMTSPPESANRQPRPQQARVLDPPPGTAYHGPDSPSYVPREYQSFSSPNGINGSNARGPNNRPQQFSPEEGYSGHARQDTIEDVYNGYYEDRSAGPPNPPIRDREAEIEAEMPNFDDPTGEKSRQKAPSDPSVQGGPQNGFYQQARAQRSQPDLRNQSRNDQRPNQGPDPRMNGGVGSPSYQQGNNVYARPAYAAFAQQGRPSPPQIATAPGALPPRQAYTPVGRNMQSPISPPQPTLDRAQTNQSLWSDPGPGYAVSPIENGSYQRSAPQSGRPSLDQRPSQTRSEPSNPDALPNHPTPAQQPQPPRPGLMKKPTGLPENRPAPVRQYNRVNTAVPTATSNISPATPSHSSTDRRRSMPITPQELERLRNACKAQPNDFRQRLYYVKKLVSAASLLSNENGTADAKTTARNRERYINDAHKEVKKLVAQNYPDAQFYLADCYGQGALGLAVDTKEAFTLYQSAAKAGHPASAYRTAVCCELGPEDGGGTRKDPIKAVQWYKRAAALGDVPAMYKMGMLLLKGLLGQPRNLGDALNWLKRAAERADEENPHALHELGLLYESQMPGQDKIIRDDRYAAELFTRAARLGYKFSQFRLGQCYEYGLLGFPIDARQSIQWYTRAAAQAEHQSELALSGWYLTGSPGILEQSDTEAYLWARKAATADPVPLPKAMFAMGYFTEVGIGCPRSLEEAKRWYGRAASYKFPKAQERLEELKKGGTKVQKSRERLSRSNKDRNDAECTVM